MMYHPDSQSGAAPTFWVTRHATTILFFILVLSSAGLYLAGRIPISVFPETNFPVWSSGWITA
jgi:hypothetical protein